jgi:hypothetical protein
MEFVGGGADNSSGRARSKVARTTRTLGPMSHPVAVVALLLLATACGGGGVARPLPQPTPAAIPAGEPMPIRDAADQRPATDAVAVSDGLVLPAVFTRHHAFIRATIGGAPALLLFDSGASATILSPRLVRRLGLAYRGRYVAFGIGEPVTGASQHEGTDIAMGPLAIRPATVLSWSDAGFPTYGRTTPDGIIGYDLLRSYVVTVDVHGGRIVAYDSSTAPPSARRSGETVPLRVTNGLPVVDMDVFATALTPVVPPVASTLPVVIDFGAGAGVQVTRDAAERLGFPARLRDARARQMVGIGGTVELLEGVADSIRIAGAAIPHAIIAADTSMVSSVALADAQGFVGTEVLRRFAVTLDYLRGRVMFEPNAALRAPFCRNNAGLCVRIEASLRGAEVYFVDPGSPGARAGIRPGNVILTIDGASVANFTPLEVDRLLDRGPGAVLEVVRSSAQFRALGRDGTQRVPTTRRPAPRERVWETVRLPNP